MATQFTTPLVIVGPTGILTSAAGRFYAIGNTGPIKFVTAHILFTTTATVGNRNLITRFADGAGNFLCDAWATGNQAASANNRYQIESGVGPTGITNGHAMPAVPNDFILPAGSGISIFDNANIDVNDSIGLANFVFLQ